MAKNDKTKPIFGLDKIPDSELLKQSRKEVGEWISYAHELEDKLAEQSQKLLSKEALYKLTEAEKREASKELRKSEIWNNIQTQLTALQKKNKELQRQNNELIGKICILSEQTTAEKPERGDYCRYFFEILKPKADGTFICDACTQRCIHSKEKKSQNYLKKKNNEGEQKEK